MPVGLLCGTLSFLGKMGLEFTKDIYTGGVSRAEVWTGFSEIPVCVAHYASAMDNLSHLLVNCLQRIVIDNSNHLVYHIIGNNA